MKTLMMIAFALMAAVGNAVFVTAQKKAVEIDNSLVYVGTTAFVCLIFILCAIPFTGGFSGTFVAVSKNYKWMILSGAGIFITFLGFNLLYTNFSASSYVYYAVLSILTTSVIAAVVVFKEKLNIFHFFAIIAAIAAVVLYSVGSRR